MEVRYPLLTLCKNFYLSEKHDLIRIYEVGDIVKLGVDSTNESKFRVEECKLCGCGTTISEPFGFRLGTTFSCEICGTTYERVEVEEVFKGVEFWMCKIVSNLEIIKDYSTELDKNP